MIPRVSNRDLQQKITATLSDTIKRNYEMLYAIRLINNRIDLR